MKRKTKISLLIAIIACMIPFMASALKANLFYSTFLSPTDGPYIETYLAVVGSSIEYRMNDNGKYQGAVEITMIFKKDNEVNNFKKYELLSPEVNDPSEVDFNFLDQQRFALPNGAYDFNIIISDKHKDTVPYLITEPVKIDFPINEVAVSGIQLVDSYSKADGEGILNKSGFNLVPYVSNFFPGAREKLIFYSELYNTQKVLGNDVQFLIKYYIESFDKKKELEAYSRFRKADSKTVNVLFSEFDINELPSGNYNLVIEARDRQNKMIAMNKLFFQRSNPNIQLELTDYTKNAANNTFAEAYTQKDSLQEYIRFLDPISTELERALIYKQVLQSDIKHMQQFLYNFWYEKDPLAPEESWLNYKDEVIKVNEAYKTITKPGYMSDRGRVYLKYGPPNAIAESYHEPHAYPYEIWHYYQLDNQRNKKFVFYTTELATNDFQLIHSDAIGEVNNYRWQMEIHNRPGLDRMDVDNSNVYEHWGSKIEDYYNNPR